MSHSYTLCAFHVVFATDHREAVIPEKLLPRIQEFTIGIARKKQIHVYAVGGMPDHLHILMAIPPTLALATAVQLIKGNLSRWINAAGLARVGFAWQEGYGGFSVSASLIPKVRSYIENQKTHHRGRDFQAEFRELLQKHGVEYDPKRGWGSRGPRA